MTRISRAAGSLAARLLPVELRVWAEALWAEAAQVPSASERAGWLAGGLWLIARECLMIRRVRVSILFVVAAVLLARTAWAGEPTGFDTGVVWGLVVTTVAVLALLPRVVRNRLGPVADSPLARVLRFATYAAILGLIVALAGVLRSSHMPSRVRPENPLPIALLLPWSVFLLLLAGYVAVILIVTAQRSSITARTLAIGTGAGISLGLVMYAIMPLGMNQYATAPWLRGTAIDPVVVLAWILLLGGPVAAAVLAGMRHAPAGGRLRLVDARIRQSIAAGLLSTLVGSLIVCVLGPVTLVLLPRAGLLVHLVYPGRQLTAATLANNVAVLAQGAVGYFLIWLVFPLIGLVLGANTGLVAWHRGRAIGPGNGPGGGGADDGDPAPVPSGDLGREPADEETSVAVGAFVAMRG
ncbi:MAG TPA: hypothetical protein VEJ42_04875 [Streptosporangiaceae bacterium]|nr:hypothetical protein [Streptosporangiaceae bacterium]